jgi:hypothetical protein
VRYSDHDSIGLISLNMVEPINDTTNSTILQDNQNQINRRIDHPVPILTN